MTARQIVHVVDDDRAMRDSLEFLLASAGFTAQVYESGEVLLKELRDIQGCILSDLRMPEIDGLELLRRIRESGRPIPVVLMTGHGDIDLAVQAMKLGASDFIEKPFDDEFLINVLQSALSRQEDQTSTDAEGEMVRERYARLSQREREVFRRVVDGEPNKVIARDLQISPRTIEIYRANMMAKMQASGLSELVRMAARAGIV